MDKILSGQAFLYRAEGLPNTVIEVKMKQNVRGDFLRRALDTAASRYPYLCRKFVEKDGDFYLQDDMNYLALNRTEKFRRLGSMSTGYHLLDVTYCAGIIRVSWHHALCDGRGIKPFVETLIYYYCCLKYNKSFGSGGIRLAGEPLLPGETDEPYASGEYEVGKHTPPEVVRDGYTLPEVGDDTTNYRFDVHMRQASFMSFAKANHATPATLVALMMSKAIKAVHPVTDKPVVCSLACDYRAALGVENTHRNCVGSVYLPFTDEIENMPLAEQAAVYRNILNGQREPNFIRSVVNGQMQMFKRVERMKSLKERQEKLSFIGDMCIDTFVVSYLGRMDFGECGGYVRNVSLYSSGYRGVRVNMIASGDSMTVNILTNFSDDSIVRAFLDELAKNGIGYKNSDYAPFDTQKDKTHLTAGRQPEKYYKKLEAN
jgi:hypothetical protein